MVKVAKLLKPVEEIETRIDNEDILYFGKT